MFWVEIISYASTSYALSGRDTAVTVNLFAFEVVQSSIRAYCYHAVLTLQRTQGGMTVLNQHASSVSRSFSLPMGVRGGAPSQPSPVLRTSSGQSLIKGTPTPGTPGSATGSQKFIIVSTAGAGATPSGAPSPGIMKVLIYSSLSCHTSTLCLSVYVKQSLVYCVMVEWKCIGS